MMNFIIKPVQSEFDRKLLKIEGDVKSSFAVIKQFDFMYGQKIQEMCDSSDIERDLRGIFMRIASLCNINLNPLDIQHLSYV